MHYLAAWAMLLSLFYGGLALAQTEQTTPPHILAAARRAAETDLPQLDAPQGWSHTILANIKTTALGCRLTAGLELPAPIEAHRLELRYGDSAYGVHVSPDASLVQLCDERFPGLRGGLVAASRDVPLDDSDGDSVLNSADPCPTVAGSPSAAQPGCPQPSASDRDGDGIADSDDLCPRQPGAAAANGCSILPDADADGVPDADDICPGDPGAMRRGFALGCPLNGSGSSPSLRQASDVCRALGDGIRLFDRAAVNAAIIGIYYHSQAQTGAGDVIGRDAASNWYRLKEGWAAAISLELGGACYNIPTVNVTLAPATGCFLRPSKDFANVRSSPATTGQRVARIYPNQIYIALGRSFGGDWLFFNQGWVSQAVVELIGDCSDLPVLDPQSAGSGTVFFCPPEYTGYLPPRITIGRANARIAAGSIPNRLRAQPSITAAQIGEIPTGRTLDAVVDGPACKENFVWWQVQVDGRVGWTAESDVKANVYYIEPLEPVAHAATASPLPATFQMITTAKAPKVSVIHTLSATSPHSLTWSPAQSSLALIHASGKIAVYSYPSFDDITADYHRLATLDATAIAFSADGHFLAIGVRDGRVCLAQPDKAAVCLPQSHAHPVRALAWSRPGYQLASASGFSQTPPAENAGTLKVWHLNGFSPSSDSHPSLFINYAFPYPLTDLAFSADNAWLAVTGESAARQRAALWIYGATDAALHFSKALVYTGYSFVTPSPDPTLGDFVYNHGDSAWRISVPLAGDVRFYHQPGERLKALAFRHQVIDGAEVLFALAATAPADSGTLRLVNALSRAAPTASLLLNPADIAFSPDGGLLAAAEPSQRRVLILGLTDP